MDKKKKLQKEPEETGETPMHEEPSNDTPTFVTEVVEEVGNEEETERQDMGKESAYEDVGFTEEKEEAEPTFVQERHEKREYEIDDEPRQEAAKKQMVEDIFSSKHTSNLVDIAINKNTKTQPAIVWAIIIIVVALVTGGGLILLTKTMGEKKETTAKPTPTVMQTIAPTPVPVEVKREDLKIQVLNGGGKAGAGSKMKTFLTDL
jgi:hypothetical protein